MDIHSRLLSRLHRIVVYFYGQTMQVPLYGQSQKFNNMLKVQGKLSEMLNDETKGRSSGGGGGGTARGLRVEKKSASTGVRR